MNDKLCKNSFGTGGDDIFFCPTCGIAQPKPKRHPIGTRVKHAKHGEGKIFSYDQCDDVSCGVDFGRKGKWCIDVLELIILRTKQ